jgi:hypothetical protein
LFFGPFTGAAVVRHDPPDRYVFNYRASYAEETSAMVRYLVKILRRLQPGQIAVLAQQDSLWQRRLRWRDQGFPRAWIERRAAQPSRAPTRLLVAADAAAMSCECQNRDKSAADPKLANRAWRVRHREVDVNRNPPDQVRAGVRWKRSGKLRKKADATIAKMAVRPLIVIAWLTMGGDG